MKIIILGVIFLISPFIQLFPQNQFTNEKSKFTKVPDVNFNVSYKGKNYKKKISDYRNKILLLDFWSTTCADCIALMPEMVDLKNQFGDKIEILVVTYNSDLEVQKLFQQLENNPKTKYLAEAGKQLGFIKNDSILQNLFPMRGRPTHVWIDKEGRYISTAKSFSTNSSNIKRLLEGKPVEFVEVNNTHLDYIQTIHNPFYWLDKDANLLSNVKAFSVLLSQIDGFGGINYKSLIIDSLTKLPNGISCFNRSIIGLYKDAYSDLIPIRPIIPDNRIILECADRTKYFGPKVGFPALNWAKTNTYCYGLKLDVKTEGQIYSYMKSDLDRLFNMKSCIEKRVVRCWVLKELDTFKGFQTTDEKSYYAEDTTKKILRNLEIGGLYYSLGDLVESLTTPSLPYMNLMKYNGKISLEFPWSEKLDRNLLLKIRKELNSCGIDLVEEDVLIDMLILKEL